MLSWDSISYLSVGPDEVSLIQGKIEVSASCDISGSESPLEINAEGAGLQIERSSLRKLNILGFSYGNWQFFSVKRSVSASESISGLASVKEEAHIVVSVCHDLAAVADAKPET